MIAQQTPTLPRYLQKANLILETINNANGIWSRTQRELCETLHISQPELSSLVKLLIENDKLMKGAPIPGIRGKNHVLIVKDATPFDNVVHRNIAPSTANHPRDRVVAPGEAVTGISDLRQYDVKLVGEAVVHALREAWTKEAEHVSIRAEQNARLHEYREQMQQDRQLRMRLGEEREDMQRQINDLNKEIVSLRKELNQNFIDHPQAQEYNTYPLREALDEESRQTLDRLMRTRPGNYRESDAELGLSSGSSGS